MVEKDNTQATQQPDEAPVKKRKLGTPIIIAIILVLLCALAAFLYSGLQQEKQEKEKLQQLAELDKKEMENEYAQFALQYDELKKSIRDDSLMQRLTEEQARNQSLLDELKKVKANDAAEIIRLKKELATVRAVLKSYIREIDSLYRVNQELVDENKQIKNRYSAATSQITSLTTEKKDLSEQVAIASQLDATGISVQAQNKRGKNAKKIKDVTRFVATFTITKNITAKTGMRTVYVRITKPTNEVVAPGGTFNYENTSIEYTVTKNIEYDGNEQTATVYVPVNEFLSKGTYHIYLFADGTMIGSSSFTLEK